MPLTTTPSNALTLAALSTVTLPGSEISAFDPASKRLFVTSNVGLSVVDLSNPQAPVLIKTINFTTLGFSSTDVSSVAVKNGVVAASIIATDKTQPGTIAFLTAATDALLGSVGVGANPDQLTFTPDGKKVLVANEGEISLTADPVGSISIIDISSGVPSATVQTAGFTAFDGQEAALRAAGVRIFAGKTVSQDMEPEYIAISADGAKAMVTLQENNAVALLDIATATVTSIVPLGLKDFSTLLADFSDRDSATNGTAIELKTGAPVFGAYMPDAIASFQTGGKTFYVMANEGDDRDDFLSTPETIRVNATAYDLDNTKFPNEGTPGTASAAGSGLKGNDSIGRLTVSNAPGLRGDTDGDGDIDQIITYGGRSFSIVDANGVRVFDSGDIIERYVASLGAPAFDDTRSDNKGPEPEGISVATYGSKTYAFVGLERSHGVMVFDVTNPADVTFTSYASRTGDLNPEGLLNISAADSPNGKPLVVVSSEVSNTLTTYQVNGVPDYTLQLLSYYGESGLLGVKTAPIMGALIDRFDDQYANTLVLGEGDSWIPGPWLVAGADPSLNAVAGIGTTALARPDVAIMNAFGTDASALGNHEFDLGSPVVQAAIAAAGTGASAWVGAQFPLITSNLNFAADSSLRGLADASLGGTATNAFAGKEVTDIKAKIAPYAVVTQGGQKIGLVGSTTFDLLTKTSPNGTVPKDDNNPATSDLQEVAAYLQASVDALKAMGVNKIVMVDQLDTLQRNKDLAGLVSGIDVMIAGGGHERMGDANDVAVAFNGHDANFIPDAFPITTTGADGKPVLIVTTDTEYTYLGRLVVDFNAAGEIILPNLDTAINGAYASTEATLKAAYNTTNSADQIIASSTIGTKVRDIVNAIDTVVTSKDGNIFGYTNVYLEGDRVFGRTEEVNFGNLSADANIAAAAKAIGNQPFLVSLKNGGGIRASIGSVDANGAKIPPLASGVKPAGAISQLDIENALRFDNKLMVFDTTPQGLFNIFNFASGLSSGPAVQSGGYAQVGGIRFSYDPDNPAARKLVNLSLVDANGQLVAKVVENGAVLADAPAKISVVTLSFTANGGDGYPIKANASNFRYLLNDGTLSAAVNPSLDFTATANTPANTLGEQKAFQDFLLAKHATPAAAYGVADTPAAQDIRIEDLNRRAADAVFNADVKNGTTGNDVLNGTVFSDNLKGLAGNDVLVSDGPISLSPTAEAINRLYLTILDRAPDANGWNALVNAANSGASLATLAANMLTSQEYVSKFGTLDNAGFVNLLYANALERAPDAGGLAAGVASLNAGALTRGAYAAAIAQSAEHRAVSDFEGNVGQVYRLFTTALGRAPDLNGFNSWLDRLDAGVNYASVLSGFTNSQEFLTATSALSNAQFVEKLYANVLGRTPDAAGLAGWVAILNGGASRGQVVSGVAESIEAGNVTKGAVSSYVRTSLPSWSDTLEGGAGDDLMTGGHGADTFLFVQGQGGSDQVFGFEAWDTVRLTGFGYANVAAAQAKLSQSGENVVFADQGQTITFTGATLAEVQNAGWLLS